MEKDLFGPIKQYFENLGYVCDGEVRDIDLYMQRGDETAAVELKVSLDFKVVQQAALRQKVCGTVYIGTFRPKDMRSAAFNDKLYLLKRLGIGLVILAPRTGTVTVVSEPIVSELANFKSSNKRKSKAISAEFKRRKSKSNIGGVNNTKLITSYREDALLVLDTLCSLGGEANARTVHKVSGIEKTSAILRANYYGWFSRTDEKNYKITDAGYNALEEFESVLSVLTRERTDL